MAVGPVEMNGIISRAQDVTPIKQNQDNKPMVDQNNFQKEFSKEIRHNLKQVHDADNSRNKEEKFDAREEGKNKYLASKSKKQKHKDEEIGKVIIKSQSRFDVKI